MCLIFATGISFYQGEIVLNSIKRSYEEESRSKQTLFPFEVPLRFKERLSLFVHSCPLFQINMYRPLIARFHLGPSFSLNAQKPNARIHRACVSVNNCACPHTHVCNFLCRILPRILSLSFSISLYSLLYTDSRVQ